MGIKEQNINIENEFQKYCANSINENVCLNKNCDFCKMNFCKNWLSITLEKIKQYETIIANKFKIIKNLGTIEIDDNLD